MAIISDSASAERTCHTVTTVRPCDPSHRSAFLFGHHISHSLSPILHKVVFEQLHPSTPSAFSFTLLDTLSIEPFRQAIFEDPSCIGASITMPHKLSVMEFVDDLSEDARIIGAINTVYFRPNAELPSNGAISNRPVLPTKRRVLGTNTDCIGIRDALVRKYPHDSIREKVHSKPALVVGAGGTARAAVYSLWKFFGVDEVYVINRFREEVTQMIESMSANGCNVRMRWVEDVVDVKRPWIVVGTVPDITPVIPEEKRAMDNVRSLLKLKNQEEDGWLLDMCYHPDPKTYLMKMAEELGWKTVSGVDAMCYGNIAQDTLWMGKVIEDDVISRGYEAVWKAVNESHI